MTVTTSRRRARLLTPLLILSLVAVGLASTMTSASAAKKSWVEALCGTVPADWNEGTIRPVSASVNVHTRGGRSKAVKGMTVVIQRKVGGRWITETKGRTNSRGHFTKKIVLKGAGPLLYRCKLTYSKKFKALRKLQQVVPIDDNSTVNRRSVASLTVQGPLYSDAPVTLTGTVSPVGVGRTVFFDTRPTDARSGATRYDYSPTPVRPDGTFSITLPRVTGTVTFRAQVGRSSDFNGFAKSNMVSVSIGSEDGLSIDGNGYLPNPMVGRSYSHTLTVTDRRAGTWTVESGALPSGLTLVDGTIAGTPASPGTSTFTVSFVDERRARTRASRTMVVDPPA